MTHAERQRESDQATQAADREYGLAMLNRVSEEQAREASSYEHRDTGFRPDETDDLWDLQRERDFEVSRDEYERFMGREQ